MKKIIWTVFCVLLTSQLYAQAKTHAFFMIGNYAYPDWEKLSFDFTRDGREITYSYRKNEQGHKLESLGTKFVNNQKALIVKIPSLNKIYLILRDKKKESLVMMSEDGKYKKKFPLGYEGPVDGRGTFCATCANEPQEAFAIVDSFF
ncbi:hypothetical protein GCM10028805_49770 [Spirosoma harenae]